MARRRPRSGAFASCACAFRARSTELDLFADALSQRSTRDDGVLLAGLDALATDALALPDHYGSPPVVCYLDRGIGAAIRRARTRLPGGGPNPVAIIRVPRERLIGSGIGPPWCTRSDTSWPPSWTWWRRCGRRCRSDNARAAGRRSCWRYWERCVSEIVADFWSVARLGIAATLGLIGVLSLPRAFVFRVAFDDPHPAPWLRVKLTCALGRALNPSPQWERLAALWDELYPAPAPRAQRAPLLERLEDGIPAFVDLMLAHRPRSLRGRSLAELAADDRLAPGQLAARYQQWRVEPETAPDTAPTLACATVGQARADDRIGAEEESRLMNRLLTQWALRRTLNRN